MHAQIVHAWWYFPLFGTHDMNATVIDTLRYADRLKEAGLEPGQAEAMSRALNDELSKGLATRTDLDNAVSALKVDIGGLGAKIDALEGTVEARFEAMDAKFEDRFEAMDAKFEDRFEAMDVKFEARFETVDAKFDALIRQSANHSRYVFLVLALIAGLGLYNATAPHYRGTGAKSASPDRAAPAAQAQMSGGADARGAENRHGDAGTQLVSYVGIRTPT